MYEHEIHHGTDSNDAEQQPPQYYSHYLQKRHWDAKSSTRARMFEACFLHRIVAHAQAPEASGHLVGRTTFRVQGLKFRVQGLGLQPTECKSQGSEPRRPFW